MNMRATVKIVSVALAGAATLSVAPSAAFASPSTPGATPAVSSAANIAPSAVRVQRFAVCTFERRDHLRAVLVWPNAFYEKGSRTYVGWWHDGKLVNARVDKHVYSNGAMRVRIAAPPVSLIGYKDHYFILTNSKCLV